LKEREPWFVSQCRTASLCSPTGFADVTQLSGQRSVLAVGSVTRSGLAGHEAAREEMRAAFEDVAILEGHDPLALLQHANAKLARAGLGRIDAIAMLSTPGDGIAPEVIGAGQPLPLVVTRDHLAAPLEGSVRLSQGWSVVLGGLDGRSSPWTDLLSSSDVAAALALLGGSPSQRPRTARTLLAVTVDG
jgi:hypothetical protein